MITIFFNKTFFKIMNWNSVVFFGMTMVHACAFFNQNFYNSPFKRQHVSKIMTNKSLCCIQNPNSYNYHCWKRLIFSKNMEFSNCISVTLFSLFVRDYIMNAINAPLASIIVVFILKYVIWKEVDLRLLQRDW